MQDQVLTQIKTGKRLIVMSVNDNALGAKLTEMGIVEGKELEILFRAPFGCPMAVDMGGHILSLRKSEAQLVKVKQI
jgi:ferrous iron transport protein A